MDIDAEGLAAQAGHTIRRSLDGWGPTLRLCLLGAVATALLGGWQVLEHQLADDPVPVVCVAPASANARPGVAQALPQAYRPGDRAGIRPAV